MATDTSGSTSEPSIASVTGKPNQLKVNGMANIANGFLEIRLTKPNKAALEELEQLIISSGMLSFEGDYDIQIKEDNLQVNFTGIWTADDEWDWLDQQLSSETSGLSDTTRAALVDGWIEGESYECECTHRDKVKKAPNETTLTRYQSRCGEFDLPKALMLVGALNLPQGGSLMVGNNVKIELNSIDKGEDYGFKKSCQVFKFTVSGTEIVKIHVVSGEQKGKCRGVWFNFDGYEPGKENESSICCADFCEFDGMNELLDDMLCNRDELFKLVKPPRKKVKLGKIKKPKPAK